ncbi:MAG: methionyl-tRNA formyltransferase [Alphaproteobacteria bacterium]
MKIVFMGTPDFACYALKALMDEKFNIICVYTQPPKEQGRGYREQYSKVHQLAKEYNILVRTPKSLRNPAAQAEFKELNADVAIVSAYGMILPNEILNATKYGCINIHPSLLPRWRGAAPIQRMMLAGDKTTGVCIMKMDAGLDTGPVISKKEIELTGKENFPELHDRLGVLGAKMLIDALKNIDNIKLLEQPSDGATYANKILKEEALINFQEDDILQIDRKIRALNPPGAYFEYNGERIKIFEAEFEEISHNNTPSSIIDNKFTIACKGGLLFPKTLQRPGKKAMKIEDFLRGFTFKL